MSYLNPWVRMVFGPGRRTPAAGKFSTAQKGQLAGQKTSPCSAFCPHGRMPSSFHMTGALRPWGSDALPDQVHWGAMSTGQSCFQTKDWASDTREVVILAKAAEEDSGGEDVVKPEHFGLLAIGVGLLPESTGGF